MSFVRIKTIPIELIISQKVRDLCRSCKRYGTNGCCPPNVEPIEYYREAVLEYKNLDIFYKEYLLKDFENILVAGKKSSIDLHSFLLKERNKQMKSGILFVTCYGGGSCKYCKECTIPCKLPEKGLSSLEAIGVNVFKTLEKFNVILPKIITSSFYRVGAMLHD